MELGKMWKNERIFIPVIGGLGYISKKFSDYLIMIKAWNWLWLIAGKSWDHFCQENDAADGWHGHDCDMAGIITLPPKYFTLLYGLMLPLQPKLFVQSWPLLDCIWSRLHEQNHTITKKI